MSEESWPKLGALAGIAAGVLFIVGFAAGPTGAPPGFSDSAAEIKSYIQDNHGQIQATIAIGFGILFTFTWFLGSVYQRLRAAEPAARVSVVALAGGLVLISGAVAGSAAEAAAAFHVDSLEPGVVQALWDLSVAGFLFVWAGLSALAAACAVLSLRAGALPTWLGYYDAAVAVYIFVLGVVGTFTETGAFSPYDGALSLIGFLTFIVWLLATGIALYREPATSGRGERTVAPVAEPMR